MGRLCLLMTNGQKVGTLLDDVVNDISVIERLITSNSNYNFRKEMI